MNKKIAISFLLLVNFLAGFSFGQAPVANFSANPTVVCAGDSVKFTDLSTNNPTSWNWTFAGGSPATSTIQNPAVYYGAPGAYTVSLLVANGSGSGNSTKNNYITVNAPPVVGISYTGKDTVCPGDSANLTASGAVTYSWAPTTGLSCSTCANTFAFPVSTTIYTVTGTGNNGCTSTATQTVTVIYPSVNAGAPFTVCDGSPVTLNATSALPGIYVWKPMNDTAQWVTFIPHASQTYTVTFTGLCGKANDTITVDVLPSPNAIPTGAPLSGCAPICVQFRDGSSVSGGGTITSRSWSFGDNDTSSAKNPIHCYTKPGVYTVDLTVVSDKGCSSTENKNNMVTVYAPPVAAFTYNPNPVSILTPTVNYTDASKTPYGIFNWTWNFNDKPDSVSYDQNPVHTYGDTGSYCTQLIITDMNGCMDTATECFKVASKFIIYIPSAFSPNGDGLNDFFAPKGEDIKNYDMYIFDRWGIQLYHTTDITKGWNGSVGGGSAQRCPEDTYVYKIVVTDHQGNGYSYIGKVELIR